MGREARIDPVAVARAVVTHRDGTKDIHYSVPKIPFWHLSRRLKLRRHLQFMRKEDEQWQ